MGEKTARTTRQSVWFLPDHVGSGQVNEGEERISSLPIRHNQSDAKNVEEVAHKLAHAGFKEVFLDRWNLLKGTRRRPMLEKAFSSGKAVANRCGTWRNWLLAAKGSRVDDVELHQLFVAKDEQLPRQPGCTN